MLKKKEYTAILGLAKSKDEIVALFNSLYSPKPAIRIIKHSYHRHDDRDYVFACDKCGKTFTAKSSKDAEYEKELCVCPHCGFSICFTPSTYYKSKEEYALDEHCQGYSNVYTDIGKRLAPTFVVFETVVFDDKRYFLVRRYHFELKQGSISKSKLYRGLIIPENEQDNYAALYENDLYELTSSSTENPFDWFDTSKYHMPHLGEFYVSEEAKPYAENMNGLKEILRAWCKWLNDSMHYYSKTSVEMREFLTKYPVDPMPDDPDLSRCYLEDHGGYLAFRRFREYGDNIIESKRWIIAYKTGYSKLLVFRNDEWQMETDFGYYGFGDAELLEIKEDIMRTEVSRLGLFEYLNYTLRTDGYGRYVYYYLTSLADVPIIETLAKIDMCYLIGDVSSGKIKVYPGQKHLWGKLGLSRENFEFAKRDLIRGEDFQRLLSINKYDSHVDSDAFYRWTSDYSKADIYSIGVIVDRLGISLKQIIEYLDSVYFDQGCECEEAIVQWRDYLRNYESFYKHNPKTDEDKFPDSLKKAHDIMTMRNTTWAYEYNGIGKKYAEVIEKWGDLEFEDEHYKIVLPKTPRDIAQEGARQHHCVAGYINSVLNKECLILFLRRKECEDRSFLTMEYDLKRHLRQIKGKFNRSIYEMTDATQEKALLKFLQAWSKKTGIETGIPKVKEAA